jgi:hypothetical protein
LVVAPKVAVLVVTSVPDGVGDARLGAPEVPPEELPEPLEELAEEPLEELPELLPEEPLLA